MKRYNEFAALSLIVDTAIKHAKHNQKSHGNRGAQYEQTAIDFDAPPAVSSVGALNASTPPSPTRQWKNPVDLANFLAESMTANWTNEEIKAIRNYAASGYFGINRRLKGRKIDPHTVALGMTEKVIDRLIKTIDSAHDKTRLPETVQLFRGVNVNNTRLKQLTKIGAIITEAGLMSTTTDQSVTEPFILPQRERKNPVVFRIIAPAGQRAISVPAVEKHLAEKSGTKYDPEGKEQEVLFPPGMKMIVRNVEKKGMDTLELGEIPVTFIDVELLPEDSA